MPFLCREKVVDGNYNSDPKEMQHDEMATFGTLPPSQTHSTPSPHQVISDCVDATCHEILLLGEDATSESYSILSERLSYYCELLDDGDSADEEDGKEPILKETSVRNRLLMAKMVISLCSRSAYPEGAAQCPSLVEFSDEDWKEFREEMKRLNGIMQNVLSDDEFSDRVSVIQELYTAVKAQAKAMLILAQLRNRLEAFLHNNREGEGSELSYPKEIIAEYTQHVGPIRVNLQAIHRTRYNGCFLPKNVLASHMALTTLDAAKKSVTSFISKIDVLVAKKAFPLQSLQVDFACLAKECTTCLPPPELFQTGYFEYANDTIEEGSIQSEEGKKKPAAAVSLKKRSSSRVYASSEEDNSPVKANKKTATPSSAATAHSKRKMDTGARKSSTSSSSPLRKVNRAKAKNTSPKRNKKERDELDFDSDAETRTSVSSSRKKRIRYTEEEKGALMEGVERFGLGAWKEILDYYKVVFKVNNRTNVNLKDLYRTLNK
jgi:hypothetical protein